MSNHHNEELKLKILDDITSMSLEEFQTLCDRYKEGEIVLEIDIAIGKLND
tara:strand:- start:317 stop:469 length:153 start_codon:yes stop_codon:yes gene_type:complete